MDSDLELDRLEAELSLLEAMYSKELLAFDRRTRELSYTASIESGGKITIRIPDGYPATKEHPQIILARDVQKQDLREHMTAFMASFTACSPDNDIEEIGEILDQVLERFCELVESGSQNEDKERQDHVAVAAQAQKTVIIWLRKLITSFQTHVEVFEALVLTDMDLDIIFNHKPGERQASLHNVPQMFPPKLV